jgi:glyoxylase-like metal-dependent hydrolase (beta-lactamase superfamily II)
MKMHLLQAGYCTVPAGAMLRGEPWRSVPVPALFALLEHPRLGPIVFDTGYSSRFLSVTRRWPYRLYAWLTPVHLRPEETAARQLADRGIPPAAVRHLIISHFHADHLGGVADFPQATFTFLAEGYELVRGQTGFGALRHGFLPDHLPPDFDSRSIPLGQERFESLPPEFAPFRRGVDVLGDGSLVGVALPGHAVGQMGLFFYADGLGPVLMAADACWHSRAYRELIFPHPAIRPMLPDSVAYAETLLQLHHLHRARPELPIIPSHCPEALARYGAS